MESIIIMIFAILLMIICVLSPLTLLGAAMIILFIGATLIMSALFILKWLRISQTDSAQYREIPDRNIGIAPICEIGIKRKLLKIPLRKNPI